jgi:hypothetical protein
MSRLTTAFVVFTIALGGMAQAADRVAPPAVPGDLVVPDGSKPFMRGHAVGTQNYICAPAPTPSGVDWLFIGPQATLFNDAGEQIVTHFHSMNPYKGDVIQATWQHSRDTSAVWAKRYKGSTDSNYVSPDAIEWLLLDATGQQVGPTGGDKLAATTWIQRVNTVGGVKPPSSECTASTLNTRKLVPYQADYYFY